MSSFNKITARLRGKENEELYAKVLGGTVTEDFSEEDLKGWDVISANVIVQVKCSWYMAKKWMDEQFDDIRARRGSSFRWVPFGIGAPGTKEETLHDLLTYGVWVGHDIENRYDVYDEVHDFYERKFGDIPPMVQQS